MHGQPGIIHDRNLVCHPVSWAFIDAWMTSQLGVVLIRKLRGSLKCLAIFYCYPWNLYNQALADVWSTCAGIKCLVFFNLCALADLDRTTVSIL